MPFFIHPKSLSLLLFLILYTLADDSTPLGPQFQDPSSSAISFPHDIDNSNGLEVSGWTTAVELGDTGDNLFDQQGVFLTADDQTTSACAGSTSSQDGSPPTPKRRSRLLRKRDPPGFCSSQDYYQNDSAPSSSGGTTTTTTITNRKPGRPPGKTTPRAKPMQIQKALPLLGDPNSPLCNQYFPGVGSSYAVCYYPYFKTILRSPLVHVLSPCRAYSFGDPCTSSEELWCCGTTWPRPPDAFQQLNPQLGIRYSIAGYGCLHVDLVHLDNVPVIDY